MPSTINPPEIFQTVISGIINVAGGLGNVSVATTARELTLTEVMVQWTPDEITLGGPEDFDGDQNGCEGVGFLYDEGLETCGINGAVTTYETNSEVAYLTLPTLASSSGKVYWISNVHATRHGYVVPNGGGAGWTIQPETSLILFNDGAAWQTFDVIDGAGSDFDTSSELRALISDPIGTGSAVFATSPTLVTPVIGVATGTSLALTKGITFTGATYTPSGATQAVNLADVPHFRLLLTSGSGTLTMTLTVPAAMSSGIFYVKQHATTQRDLVIASATTISWLGTEPDWVADAVGTERAVPWSYDGVTLHLQGESTGATDLAFTRDLDSLTVTSSTGDDVELPAASTTLAGVLTAAKKVEYDTAVNLFDTQALIVNGDNGWCSTTLMYFYGGDDTWFDGVDTWNLGYFEAYATEDSGGHGTSKLRIHGVDGALLINGSFTLGVNGMDGYVISQPSNFRTELGLGTMALAATSSYLAIAGGTLTGPLTGTSGIIEQRDSTTAQTLRVYGTYTDASNYVRGSLTSNGTSSVTFAAETAGTGADNIDVIVLPAGTGKLIAGGTSATGTFAQTFFTALTGYANYGAKFESTGANIFNEFKTSTGSGQFGISGDAMYFEALTTLSGGIQFYSNSTLTLDLLYSGSVKVGKPSLATNATAGFIYIPSCAGTPTGAPTSVTGMLPMVIDSTNNKLYFYSGGSWRDAGP